MGREYDLRYCGKCNNELVAVYCNGKTEGIRLFRADEHIFDCIWGMVTLEDGREMVVWEEK